MPGSCLGRCGWKPWPCSPLWSTHTLRALTPEACRGGVRLKVHLQARAGRVTVESGGGSVRLAVAQDARLQVTVESAGAVTRPGQGQSQSWQWPRAKERIAFRCWH